MRMSRALKPNITQISTSEAPLETRKPTFVTRYDPTAKKAFKILRKHWSAINTGVPILKRFLKCTPRLAYRANPNLAKKLVRAKIKPTQEQNPQPTHNTELNQHNTHNDTNNDNIAYLANLIHFNVETQMPGHRSGMSSCSNSICPLHSRLINAQQVRSKITRRTYNTHGQATCDTPCVVYLIQCKVCGLQYVGQTQKSLKARFATHIKAIRDSQKRGVLQEHFKFGRCGNIKNIKLQMLHTLTPGDNDTARQTEETLKQLETLWINRLRSEFPQGLNWINYDSTVRY